MPRLSAPSTFAQVSEVPAITPERAWEDNDVPSSTGPPKLEFRGYSTVELVRPSTRIDQNASQGDVRRAALQVMSRPANHGVPA